MNKLSTQRRAQIGQALVEGNSIRATCRMTDAAKNTVVKLLVDLGTACEAYQDRAMRDLPCRRLQCDEIWSFCYAKEKNVSPERQGQFRQGDVWTWTAIDADTKLVPTWYVGRRTADDATDFMADLTDRLANRVQLTTDGHRAYLTAVAGAFGDEIDYAQLVKIYGVDPESERRYSPPTCIGTDTTVVSGDPDPAHVSTSYVERQNLTMRMSMRRFTRLTNAFSKKVENLMHAVSLHFMYYNFARVHGTLKTTPAMKAGVADHVWTIEDIIGLLDSN
ncbi:MAG: IS1 family transposase [Chloroflexota bacterium]|nr:IS1 family transposase [Chloroflexota bacterium]